MNDNVLKMVQEVIESRKTQNEEESMKLGIVANLPRFIFSIKAHKTQ